MARVCILLAEGFEEIEAVTPIDVLRRAGIDVTIAAAGASDAKSLAVTGSHGIRITADTTVEAAFQEAWDMVILPGGMPGATNLRDDPAVQALVKKQHAAGRNVAAICAAPMALGAAGILDGKRATSYPGFDKDLPGAEYVEDRVVCDGNIVTSRGPGTSLEFALEILRVLGHPDKAAELQEGMLVRSGQ